MKTKWTLGLAALTLTASAAWAAENGFTTNRTGASVTAFDAATGTIIQTITVGTTPIGIQVSAARKRVYVTNNGATPGTVSVINTDALTVVNTITVANSTQLEGMSMSDDGDSIFIAGRNTSLGEAGVFQLNLNTETVAYVSGTSTGATATSCAVIRASAVGGSGNGPGKVYYSVPAANFIGIRNLVTSTSGSISITGEYTTPRGMDRSPDHSLVYAGVADAGATLGVTVARIVTATDAATALVIQGGPSATVTRDVVFRPSTSPLRVYIVGSDGGNKLWEWNETTSALTGPVVLAASAGLAVSHNRSVNEDRIYLGDVSGTVATFDRYDASASPPTALATYTSGGNGPCRFVFIIVPPPVVEMACPKGDIDVAGKEILVKGKNFVPGAVIKLSTLVAPVSLSTTFVDTNTLRGVKTAPVGTRISNVIVQNPDTQSNFLETYYSNFPGTVVPFSLPLPLGHYEMKSFPQFATVAAFRQVVVSTLGPYNPSLYRIFYWDMDRYRELMDPLFGPPCDLSGHSFFVITRNGGFLTLAEPDVFANLPAGGGPRVVPLKPGWNMIAPPFKTGQGRYRWIDLRVTTSGSGIGNAPAVTSVAGQAVLHNQPFEFVNGVYLSPSVLEVGRGYWVFNKTSSLAYLVFDSSAAFKPGQEPVQSYAALAPGDPVPPAPPGGISAGASSSGGGGGGGGCGLLGVEFLLIGFVRLAFRRARGRRALSA